MRRFALILWLWPGRLPADEVRMLTGEDIKRALLGKKPGDGGGVSQIFGPFVQTRYSGGTDRAWLWAVRSAQTCSIRLSPGLRSRYDVLKDAETMRVADRAGAVANGISFS